MSPDGSRMYLNANGACEIYTVSLLPADAPILDPTTYGVFSRNQEVSP